MPDSWERTGTDDAPVWKLEFEHRPGLVVRCTVPSIRARLITARVAPALARRDADGRALLALAEVFAEDCLLDWNLTWGGRARECSAAGIARVDDALVSEILHAWVTQWAPAPPPPDPAELPTFPELDELALDLVDLTDPDPEGEPAEPEPELAVTGA